MTIDERPYVRDPRHTGDGLHASASAGLEGLIESTAMLRRQLESDEQVCRRVLADVRDQVPMSCTLPTVGADVWRSALTDAIKCFETTRHHARLVLVAMSLEEGSSISEIARTWGVSRQLASRWVQEAGLLRSSCGANGQDDRRL